MIKAIIRGKNDSGKSRLSRSMVEEGCYVNPLISGVEDTKYLDRILKAGFGEMPVAKALFPGNKAKDNYSYATRNLIRVLGELEKLEGKLVCLDEPFENLSKEGFKIVSSLVFKIADELNIDLVIIDSRNKFETMNILDLDNATRCKICNKSFIKDSRNTERSEKAGKDLWSAVKEHWSYDKSDNSYICNTCCRKQGLPVD